jgi:hypothetical protein
MDHAPMADHFRALLGAASADGILAAVQQELDNPLHYFDAIYCINLDARPDRWQAMQPRLEALGIARRVRRLRAVTTPSDHHLGCALSHRQVIAAAARQKLENVLIIEDDALFLDTALAHLSSSIAELRRQSWEIFYLGGHRWATTGRPLPGCRHLLVPERISCSHAIAIHRSAFAKLLADLPEDAPGMETFLRVHGGIDQYYPLHGGRCLVASPVVASQGSLLPAEDPAFRMRFR